MNPCPDNPKPDRRRRKAPASKRTTISMPLSLYRSAKKRARQLAANLETNEREGFSSYVRELIQADLQA